MNRRPFDPAALVLGALVTTIGLVHLSSSGRVHAGWLPPLVLVGLGVAFLAAAIRRRARQHQA